MLWEGKNSAASRFIENIASLGDIEYMRQAMPGQGVELEAGQLYWLTDR